MSDEEKASMLGQIAKSIEDQLHLMFDKKMGFFVVMTPFNQPNHTKEWDYLGNIKPKDSVVHMVEAIAGFINKDSNDVKLEMVTSIIVHLDATGQKKQVSYYLEQVISELKNDEKGDL